MKEIQTIKKCAEIAKGCDNKISEALTKVVNNPKSFTPRLLEMYGKIRDKFIVNISKPYTKPELSETAVAMEPKTPQEFQKMKEASIYYNKSVSSNIKKLIKGILKNKNFKAEADKIFKDSVDNEREMGALRVYFRDAMFFVYNVGTPSKERKNAMSIEKVDSSLGFHFFTWHPHPKGNPEPTPRSDLKGSFNHKRPGVIKYGKRDYQITIFLGDLK